ncbi:MAG: hypothetical protein LQ345_001754 [Seirophora villosa]|nr:MAG: hypothetical protein LQ345_001754 [Seirophora villosa]
MAADSKAKALLVNEGTKGLSAPLGAEHLVVIDVSSIPTSLPTVHQPILAKPNTPAAILYTSGSTGAPKGIILNHSSFVNIVEVSSQRYGLRSADMILQQSALNFDMSLLQIFLALALGGTLCLVPRSARGNSLTVSQLLCRESVSFTCATPSEYINWINYGDKDALRRSAWKAALSGGEPVSPGLLHFFRSLEKPELLLYKGYGPTETTCYSTQMQIEYTVVNHKVSAGFPSPNQSVYILDENLQLVPVGVPGEIVVGGTGVAAGYIHDY